LFSPWSVAVIAPEVPDTTGVASGAIVGAAVVVVAGVLVVFFGVVVVFLAGDFLPVDLLFVDLVDPEFVVLVLVVFLVLVVPPDFAVVVFVVVVVFLAAVFFSVVFAFGLPAERDFFLVAWCLAPAFEAAAVLLVVDATPAAVWLLPLLPQAATPTASSAAASIVRAVFEVVRDMVPRSLSVNRHQFCART
jgi:hypothetical protein